MTNKVTKTAPERVLQVSDEWRRLYKAVNELMVYIGFYGLATSRNYRVEDVMDALAELDGGSFTDTPPAPPPSKPRTAGAKAGRAKGQ